MLTTTRQRFTLPTPAPSLAIIIPLQRCSLKASPNLSRGILPPSSAWHYSRAIPRCLQMPVISHPEAWTHQQGLRACKEPAPSPTPTPSNARYAYGGLSLIPLEDCCCECPTLQRKRTERQDANLETYHQVAWHFIRGLLWLAA